MKTLVTNAYVLDMVGNVANIEKKDILINDNIIEKIDKNIDKTSEECERINARNMLVMPGIVNTHSHFALCFFCGFFCKYYILRTTCKYSYTFSNEYF